MAPAETTLEQRVRREQRRLAGWPALLGLLLGAVLTLRLRALDDRLLTRDVQALLLATTLLAGFVVGSWSLATTDDFVA